MLHSSIHFCSVQLIYSWNEIYYLLETNPDLYPECVSSLARWLVRWLVLIHMARNTEERHSAAWFSQDIRFCVCTTGGQKIREILQTDLRSCRRAERRFMHVSDASKTFLCAIGIHWIWHGIWRQMQKVKQSKKTSGELNIYFGAKFNFCSLGFCFWHEPASKKCTKLFSTSLMGVPLRPNHIVHNTHLLEFFAI